MAQSKKIIAVISTKSTTNVFWWYCLKNKTDEFPINLSTTFRYCLSERKAVWYKLNWFNYHLKNEILLHRVLRLTRFEVSLMFGSPFFYGILVDQVLQGTSLLLGGRILAPTNLCPLMACCGCVRVTWQKGLYRCSKG